MSSLIIAAGAFLKTRLSLINQYGGVRAFENRYQVLKDVKQYKEKKEQEIVSAYKHLERHSNLVLTQIILLYSYPIIYSHTRITIVLQVLSRFRILLVSGILNTQFYRRRQMPARRSKDYFVNTIDQDNVHDLLKTLSDYIYYMADNNISNQQARVKRHRVSREQIHSNEIGRHLC